MAKSVKQQELEAVQKAAIRFADTVSNEKRTKLVRRTFGKKDIKQFEDKKIKKEVTELIRKRFDEYLKAAKAFNDARIKSAVAKVNLQRALDKPFLAQEWIAESKLWVIKEIDDAKNIIFQDWQESFETTFERAVRIASRRGHPNTAINAEAWDFSDKDTPEEENAEDYIKTDDPQGTPEEETEDTPKEDAVATSPDFLAKLPALLWDYEKLQSIDDKMSLYRNNLKDDTERELFFEALDKPRRKALYAHITKQEKKLVWKYARD
jgi:hypothetical protein